MVVEVRRLGGFVCLSDLRKRTFDDGRVIRIPLRVVCVGPLLMRARSFGEAIFRRSCIAGGCAVVSGCVGAMCLSTSMMSICSESPSS